MGAAQAVVPSSEQNGATCSSIKTLTKRTMTWTTWSPCSSPGGSFPVAGCRKEAVDRGGDERSELRSSCRPDD